MSHQRDTSKDRKKPVETWVQTQTTVGTFWVALGEMKNKCEIKKYILLMNDVKTYSQYLICVEVAQ